MEIIACRLSNGVNNAFEFNAVDANSLADGCARAWAYFNTSLASSHWLASSRMNEFSRYIDECQRDENSYIARWKLAGKTDAQIEIALKNLRMQWNMQTSKMAFACQQSMLPGRLQLHVQSLIISKNQKYLNPRNAARPVYVHADASKNDWSELWQAVTIMRNHERNLLSLCRWTAEPPKSTQQKKPLRPALTIVSNMIR